MRLVLDVENTTQMRNDKWHLDPYEEGNFLVQVGMQNADNAEETFIVNIDHVEAKDTSGAGRKLIQDILDMTTLLIMHNAQHDLMWLWECGFKYDCDIYDTMLAEYILLRGQKDSLSLDGCAQRRQLTSQKDDTLKKYFKDGYNTNEIPLKELTFYLQADLDTTRELFHAIEADYGEVEAASLDKVKAVTFDTCKTLTRMYMAGFKVDRVALDAVRKEFEQEKADIEDRLQHKVREIMGDTPINLNSPEQMSQVVFSRKINNKKEWANLFEYANDKKEFKQAIEANSTLIRRTKAFTCPECKGEGKVFKIKKDGTKFSRPNKCKDCEARGYQLKNTNILAGLSFAAPTKKWVSANGFSTGKDNLDVLIGTAKTKGMDDAISFLTDLKRLSAVSSYLSSFVEGIDTFTKNDGFLHVSLTQHITAT